MSKNNEVTEWILGSHLETTEILAAVSTGLNIDTT